MGSESNCIDAAWYPGEAVSIVVLGEVQGRTTLIITIAPGSREARDAVLATLIENGLTPGHDRLAELLLSPP